MWLSNAVDISIVALCPFERDVGATFALKSHKLAIEPLALLFQYAGNDLYAVIAQAFYTPTAHSRKGIEAAYYYARYARCNDEVAARWRFAVVGARFERNIYGRTL